MFLQEVSGDFRFGIYPDSMAASTKLADGDPDEARSLASAKVGSARWSSEHPSLGPGLNHISHWSLGKGSQSNPIRPIRDQ